MRVGECNAPMHRIALCYEIPPAAGTGAPLVIELIPAPDAAGRVTGRDGRSWLFDEQARVELRRQFDTRGIDIVIDRDHASELRAPHGDEAPAAGWIRDLEIRADGSVWGIVEWTPRGADQVRNREWRYASPVFDFEPATNRIARLVSVGLVNKPNLRMSALNKEEPRMKISTLIAAALALPADTATEADVVAAIDRLKADVTTARNAEQTPSLEKFVPRSDYDAVLTRAANAETKIKEAETAAHTAAVNAALDAASKAGKITPASIDYHRASCSDAAGLERFRAFVGAAPVIAPDAVASAGAAKNTTTALNADEQRIVELTGVAAKDFIATRDAMATA